MFRSRTSIYLGQFFCPVGLAGLYPRPGLDVPLWQTAGALAILLGITAAAVIGRRRFPYLLVGWLWFLGMSVPMIGFVQFGVAAVADRNTYLTADRAGDCHRLGRGGRLPGRAAISAEMGCRRGAGVDDSVGRRLAADMVLARQRNLLESRIGLHVEQHDRARQLGRSISSPSGRPAEAAVQYRKALAIDPRNVKALNGLGGVYRSLGQLDKAEEFLRKALAVDPNDPGSHNNLGLRLDEAGTAWRGR